MAGIHKKVARNGSVKWELTHGSGDKRVRFVCGTTKSEAEAALRQFKRQLALHDQAPEALSIDNGLARYCQHLQLNRKPSTWRRYRRVLETFFLCFLVQFYGRVKLLHQIRPLHLEEYKRRRINGEIAERERRDDDLREAKLRQRLRETAKSGTPQMNAAYGFLGRKRMSRQVTKTTVNYELKTLSSFFRYWIKQGQLLVNPAENVELFRVAKRRTLKFWTAKQLEAFFGACDPFERRAFALLLLSGMRRGEIEHLEWNDIEFDEGVILIQAKADWSPKTFSSERAIPITPALRSILTEHYQQRRSDRWVIGNRVGNRETHLLSKLKKVCRKASITPASATLHALRHSFGAHLRMAGTPLTTIGDLLGHSDLATTQIYTRVGIGYLRDAADQLTPLVAGLPAVASVEGSQSAAETALSLKPVTQGDTGSGEDR